MNRNHIIQGISIIHNPPVSLGDVSMVGKPQAIVEAVYKYKRWASPEVDNIKL
jgi:hypothetical protein